MPPRADTSTCPEIDGSYRSLHLPQNNNSHHHQPANEDKQNVGSKTTTQNRTTAKRLIGQLVPSPFSSPSSPSTTVGDLIFAIQTNSVRKAKQLLENGVDPNAPLWLSHNVPIDMVFLWKRIFGENCNLVHLAIINVYHRHADRLGGLNKALEILELLLVHGGNVSKKDTNMFVCRFPKATKTCPMDLAQGLRRLALCTFSPGGKLESALDACLEILQQYCLVKRSQPGEEGATNIPFNMISLEDAGKIRNLLFSSKSPEATVLFLD